ncbi:MAG: transcription antitermination factor NusB [bacterium JZ-2024 1]
MVQGSTLKRFSRSREVAFRILFMLDQSGQKVTRALKHNEEFNGLSPDLASYARKIIRGVYSRRNALDALYAPHLEGWRLERISPVDRTIIRIALYEITGHLVDISVAIDEAVELAKIYGTEDSPRFVNGILGTTVRSLEASAQRDRNPGENPAP